MTEVVNWDSMTDASDAIFAWANRTFPGRGPKSSINKLGMEELPELLIHLKEKGLESIGEEWADCMILLLDLARIWKIDPARAIERKMQINNHRMWRKDDETGFYNHVSIDHPTPDFSGADAARRSRPGGKEEGPREKEVAQTVEEWPTCSFCFMKYNPNSCHAAECLEQA